MLALCARLGGRLPTLAAPVLAVAVCWPLAELPPRRFLTGDDWHYPAAPVVTLLASLAAFAIAARSTRADLAHRTWANVSLAALTMGAFLCVPETGVLRLTPGPLVSAAAAVAATRRIQPLGPATVTAVAAVVTYLALIGAPSRPGCLFGVSCGIALAATATVAPATAVGRRFGPLVPSIAVGAALIGARLVGTMSSTSLAGAFAAASLLLAGTVWAWARATGQPVRAGATNG